MSKFLKGTKGVKAEWHLVKLLGMSIFSHFLAGYSSRFNQQWKGFWPSFHRSGLDTPGPIADTLLRHQPEQRVDLFVVGCIDLLYRYQP